MEKRTEETIRERELGVFQTLSLHRKISRLFFFFKEKQAPGNELFETSFMQEVFPEGKKRNRAKKPFIF